MVGRGPIVSDVPAPRRSVPMRPNALAFGVRAGLRREGERGTADPAGVAAVGESPCTRRCGHSDADRPAGAIHVRPVGHRQANRGRRGAIPVTGLVLRHRDIDGLRGEAVFVFRSARQSGWPPGRITEIDPKRTFDPCTVIRPVAKVVLSGNRSS